MEAPLERPRLRNPIACEQCKLKKTRCNPSDVEGKCQKCLKSGQACIPSERNPRPRKQRVAKTSGRVAELEKKLEELLSSIEVRGGSVQSYQGASSRTQSTAGPEEENEIEVLMDIHKSAFPDGFVRSEESSDEDVEASESFSPWKPVSIATPESSTGSTQPIRGGFLDSKECQELLSSFRRMMLYFPFIIVPEEMDVKSLSEERHFLFLAIMAAASFSHATKFQAALDNQFRQILSQRVIIGGQKSLEIVQGILIYLAWYPYHINPRNAQTFQFLQIAISMCNDLGLDQPTKNSQLLERQRTYLGVYYFSASFSIMFNKPNNIEYTEYTRQCCDLFTIARPEYPTDPLLPWMVNLYHSAVCLEKSPMSTMINFEPFNEFLETFTPNIQNPKTIELVSLFKAFHESYLHTILSGGGYPNARREPVPLQIRQQHLRPCFDTCIKMFDMILSLPVKSYRSFTVVQWGYIISSIVRLIRLCFPIYNMPMWDSDAARKEGKLRLYIEGLCYRMNALGGSTRGKGKGKGKNQFALMGVVLEFVKNSYETRVEKLNSNERNTTLPSIGGTSGTNARSQTSTTTLKGPTRCPMLNGTLRSIANDPSSAWHPSPSTPINDETASSYDPYNIMNEEMDLDFGDWGTQIGDFSSWDNWDWDMGDVGLGNL